MKIRAKIVLIVLPILMSALLITGLVASYSARSGLTRLAMDALSFKAQELDKYMQNQWNLLVENDLSGNPEYVKVAKAAIESYATTVIQSETEILFAVDADSRTRVALSTSSVNLGIQERSSLYTNIKSNVTGWIELEVGGTPRVGHAFFFTPFNWYVVVSEESAVFYREVTEITLLTAYITGGSALVATFMLLIFSGVLTRPITRVVRVMKRIISDNDLSQRVQVEYSDEIGELAQTFNIMTRELDRAYQQIKQFALKAVLAQKNEHKIRNIFQKYVPKDVIDSIFSNPEKMLVGENRVLAILFSDIRSFTTISEGYMPDELVEALNHYFSIMVDIIMSRGGIIDKYIGDAIMAFFGAPVKHDDDALQAVKAGLEMQEALKTFNSELEAKGKPKFITGIGINYGVVTVGNIGSEKKMDYTIIGDMVNLGSRLEGLTKPYKQDIIISESVFRKVSDHLPCRLTDKVIVKGKTSGESIYTVKKKVSDKEEKAWDYYHTGLTYYYGREFEQAAKYFMGTRKLLPNDYLAEMYLQRCKSYIEHPPGPEWTGMEKLTSK